jgi:hypothetical protein
MRGIDALTTIVHANVNDCGVLLSSVMVSILCGCSIGTNVESLASYGTYAPSSYGIYQ